MNKLLSTAVVILFTTLSSFAQLSNMNPNSGALGQSLGTTITSMGGIFMQVGTPAGNVFDIKLRQGADSITVFEYWSGLYNVTVVTSDTVKAQVNIPLTVPPGVYDLDVTTGDVLTPWISTYTYTLPAAFTVSPPDGYVQGNVYHDLNGNGVKDGGEPGVSGRDVLLMPTNSYLITDLNGNYSFPVLNGNYNVVYLDDYHDRMYVTSLDDTIPVTINNNNSTGNDLGINNAITSITPDFGLRGGASTYRFVSDVPIFTSGPNPSGNVYGVHVNATPDFAVSANAVTMIDSVTIEATIPIPVNTTIADSIDLYVDIYGVDFGQHYMRKKFRVEAPDGNVMGQVYKDINRNGIKDAGEPGISNYQVKLLSTNQTILTDVNGNYSIPALNGNHTVTVLSAATDYMFVTSGDSLSVLINNGNSTGNDFGLKNALVSVTPNVSYPGFAQTHQIVADEPIFIPGGNPNGNINQIAFYTTPVNIVNINTSVTVIDSFTVQLVLTVPANVLITDSIDIRIALISGLSGLHFLRQKFRIEPPQSFVTGRLFYDVNQDKINDPGEPGIYYGKVKLMPDNSFAFSDNTGNFTIGSNGGIQNLTYENNISGLVIFTDSTSYTFDATGNVTGKDFGFQSAFPDYHISVTRPYSFRRCNSNQGTTFMVTNSSNVAYDAVAWVHHSPNMTYVSSSLPPTNISNDTIYWSILNLQPYSNVHMIATFLLPGAGDTAYVTTGAISLDAGGAYQLSDTDSNFYPITCAYDPNDKAVTPPGLFAQNFTLMSDTLEYLIRFQNTGNDTALNIVVLDTLDSDLDYNTFEVLGSSHSVQTELQGNGAIRFAFDNIMLPDSNVNEPESHGYVRYRIVANQGLLDSTEVVNTAHIFFDFNPDVITNTTLNTLVFVLPVGIGEISPDEKVLLYPNPFSHSATLLFENQSAEKYTLTLTAITGNKIGAEKSTNGNNFVIEKGKMSKGIYFYNLTNTVTNKMHIGKFVVE